MGTRRKQPLSVYLDPEDPVIAYLSRFKDKSAEAARLLRVGLQMVTVTMLMTPLNVAPAVNVTETPACIDPAALLTNLAPMADREAVDRQDLDPDWDD